MKTIRYVVRIWSQTASKWRTSYESSLRQAIALTYDLTTLWTVVDNTTGHYIAAHTNMLFEATRQWKHNVRAFIQSDRDKVYAKACFADLQKAFLQGFE